MAAHPENGTGDGSRLPVSATTGASGKRIRGAQPSSSTTRSRDASVSGTSAGWAF